MRHGSLFSGIGGFDLAAEWMGWDNIFHCEWNKFGQTILKYYWPKAISYDDITKTDFTIHRGNIDILTGGFPCQPYSNAGKRKGTEDDRHLWPEMLRAIREIQPSYIVGENVRGLTNWNGGLVFDQVQAEMEAEGYEVLPFLLPACAVNAPHRRDRIWFIAYSRCNRERKGTGKDIRPERIQSEQQNINDMGIEGTDVTITGSQRCDNRSDNRQERYIQTNKGTAKKNKSKGNGWKRGTGKVGEVIANTERSSIEGKHEQQSKQGKFRRYYSGDGINNFQNFPTQSPVCNGDDGLSSRLDGITFPNWRTESIKGGGNAIVPKVAYEIFKAIQTVAVIPL